MTTEQAQPEELDDEQDGDIDDFLNSVTPDQIVGEIMDIQEQAKGLKRHYAQLRKAKNGPEIDRLLKRAPVVDIPDIISALTERVSGSFVAAFKQIESVSVYVEELAESVEYLLGEEEGEESYEELAEAAEMDPAAIEVARRQMAKLERLLDFVEGLGDIVPEDVKLIIGDMRTELVAGKGVLDKTVQNQASTSSEIVSGSDSPVRAAPSESGLVTGHATEGVSPLFSDEASEKPPEAPADVKPAEADTPQVEQSQTEAPADEASAVLAEALQGGEVSPVQPGNGSGGA